MPKQVAKRATRKPEPLDVEVKRLLNEQRGSWKTIEEKGHVSYSWISKFVNDKIESPSYDRLSSLRDFLVRAAAKTR